MLSTTAVVFAAGLALALAGPTTPKPPPTPPAPKPAESYYAEGFILLPYANITEPFTAYYDTNLKKSRIDYYNQTMRTFQIATKYTNTPAAGAAFKIVFSPNRVTHLPETVCYQANATNQAPVAPQTIIPDIGKFTYNGTADCSKGTKATPDVAKKILNGTCDVWRQDVVNLNRTNVYLFYAQKVKNSSNYIPARYVTVGRNALFGSHFDEYELIYSKYEEKAQNDEVFDPIVSAGTGKCVPYPAGSGLSAGHLFNPMAEFVHHDETHLDEHFDHFKAKHGKKYQDDEEESLRKNNFRHNQRFINSQNRKNTDYALGINHLADLHRDELKSLRGGRYTVPKGALPFPAEKYAGKTKPTEFDWRDKGVVTPVKDQAICGSCWSFGTTGHLEAMYAIQYNKTVIFSEQQLIDCSWNYGNGGCDGGQDYQAYNYIIDHGLSAAQDYNKDSPYLGIDGKCHDTTTKVTLPTLYGYANCSGVENLKTAVTYVGPISVGIDAAHDSFGFYSHGIFSDPACKNTVKDLDHSVLVVGYGTANNTDYWIIKNSWSTHWGNEGYIRMASANNLCGVATAPTYALLPEKPEA